MPRARKNATSTSWRSLGLRTPRSAEMSPRAGSIESIDSATSDISSAISATNSPVGRNPGSTVPRNFVLQFPGRAAIIGASRWDVNSSAFGASETSRTSGLAQALHRLRNHVDRFLERQFPERLYARSLIIVVTPVVVLQLIMTYMFMERHYETATRSLAESYVSDVVLLINLYNKSDQGQAAVSRILGMANGDLKLGLSILEKQSLPEPIPSPAFSSVDRKLRRYVWNDLKLPFWLDTTGTPDFVDLRIEVKPNTVFRFVTPIARAKAPTRPLFLFAVVSSSLVLICVAIDCLRVRSG